ncbi:uncharacterized protein RCC_08808 [Ramularia collo-cygni]|uniref:Uncharacterized protein n=1 Tax=Ramularia collo-cygni TaxID=112498 RepID=A0A2D3VN26_9PEZI|nr:uncharacterized protein RCC_08808 [Ramularia collo-cygni]CZT23098.1 uncharacterized protein RCC_08808 [Ramularia collo-cygni]
MSDGGYDWEGITLWEESRSPGAGPRPTAEILAAVEKGRAMTAKEAGELEAALLVEDMEIMRAEKNAAMRAEIRHTRLRIIIYRIGCRGCAVVIRVLLWIMPFAVVIRDGMQATRRFFGRFF